MLEGKMRNTAMSSNVGSARANPGWDVGGGRAEDFAWDELALVRRGGESFICEPHVGGGRRGVLHGNGTLSRKLIE